MSLLMHPAYFPNCQSMAAIARGDVIWEAWDNYQKQTYRNRCYVCTDRGRQILNIPIRHVGGADGRQRFRDVRVDNSYTWQRQHWRTLETAYRSAPFFEFYEEDLRPFFEKQFEFLYDLDLATIAMLCSLFSLECPESRTSAYEARPQELLDLRPLVIAKSKQPADQPYYHQVFEDRHGFLPGLSVLDLLFNEGPAALTYINQLELPSDA